MRWDLRYSLSLRDVEELLEERGLEADHSTIWRWVQRYASGTGFLWEYALPVWKVKMGIPDTEEVVSKIDVDQAIRDLEAGKTPEWIVEHLRIYRESGGSEGHLFDASLVGGHGIVPALLLTTTGRRSGKQRTSPLFYGSTDKAYVVLGSKGGADTQPGWYLNLLANPAVEVQVGKERFTTRARVATGKERAQLWEQMVQLYPPYRDYQKKTRREIPVVVLKQESTHV